jgi:hypothetical protein
MQLSRSIFCLIFLAGIYLGVCSLGGQIKSEARNITAQVASGGSTRACLASLKNIPAGWVFTEIKADPSPFCTGIGKIPVYSVKIQNLNGMAPGSTATACVSARTVLPAGWVVTKAAATTTCAKDIGEFYATAVIKNIEGLDTIDACVTSVDNIPEGWMASSVTTTGNGDCPNVFKAIQFAYVTLDLLVPPNQKPFVCLSSLKSLPTGWVAKIVSADITCGTIGSKGHVRARLTSTSSGEIRETGANTKICIETPNFGTGQLVPADLLVSSTEIDFTNCPTVNGVTYVSATIVYVG